MLLNRVIVFINRELSRVLFDTTCGFTNYIKGLKIKIDKPCDSKCKSFYENGYVVFGENELIEKNVLDELKNEVEQKLQDENYYFEVEKDGFETQRRISKPHINVKTLDKVFTDNFFKKISSALGYDVQIEYMFINRFFSLPENKKQEDIYGNLWHFDYFPPRRPRLIMTLNDIIEDSDPTVVLTKEESIKALQLRYRGRKKLGNSKEYLESFKKNKNNILIGKAGTTVLFDSALILHRQGIPANMENREYLFLVLAKKENKNKNWKDSVKIINIDKNWDERVKDEK